MENGNNLKLNIKRTWKYIKLAKLNLVGYVIIAIVNAVISVILPLISAKIILGITNALIDQLVMTALAVFFISLINNACGFFKTFFAKNIHFKVLIGLQKDIAKEMLKIEIEEIDKKSSGLFIERLNKDTNDMSDIFMEYAYWISYIISNVGVLVTVFILNKYLFIFAVITSLVLFLINKKGTSAHYKYQKQYRIISEKKTGLTSELVRGIRDIRILNANDAALKKVYERIEESTNEQIHMLRSDRFYGFIVDNCKSIFHLLFILLGCFLYNHSLLTIPVFIIIYNYQSKIQNLLNGVVFLNETNKKFDLAASRVYEIIENDTFKKESFGNVDIKKLEGNIKFKNVTFGYDDRKVLKGMDFEIKPNERVGFVGKSGAGKTTIFGLITKLYHRDSGEILFDNYNIDDLTRSSLRDNMSIITQNPYIFNFSIKDNLLLAKEDATMKEIRNACKLACIDDYIMTLPDKYDTVLGENGVILSGGQKQRLAIARALLMKTEIILFDEATSALDNETQSKIQEAINNLKGEYTILIVAHRLTSVIDCDRIFVVDDGKIIDQGTHKELMKKSSFYKNLYNKESGEIND